MMSPMYHRLAKRIDAHVKICVLALLLKRIIEIYCDDSWKKIYDKLDLLQVTEYRSNNHAFFRRNEIDLHTKDILKMLEISMPKPILALKKMPSNI